MLKKYKVVLTGEERELLEALVSKGKSAAKKLIHARILLKADESQGKCWRDEKIREALEVGRATVERVRKQFVEEGIESALNRKKREHGPNPKKFDGEKEARLIAIACSKAPKGRTIWTLKMLADRLVELEIVDSVAPETIRKTLKKTKLNLG